MAAHLLPDGFDFYYFDVKQQINHMSLLLRERCACVRVNSLCAHTVVLDVLGNIMVDCGRQSQVEETICLGSPRQRHDVCVELGE